MVFVIHVCQLDSQAMAFTSPGLVPGQLFNPPPLANANEQAGAMPPPGSPMQMAAWQQYQQQIAHAYTLQALGTAPMLPPMMAATVAPPLH